MKNRNLSLSLFLLLILTVNTIGAEKNISSSNSLKSSTGISSFDITTFHTKDFYRINATLSFDNTTTLSSISAVILKAADGKEAPLNLINLQDKFYYGELYYNSQPSLGQMFIIVTYTSNQKDTVSKNVDNFIDGIPEIEYPLLNGLFSPINPTFKWKRVQDDKATIKYRIVVSRNNYSIIVWQINDLTENSIKYNQDGRASEQLTNRGSYSIQIFAYDDKNNVSYTQSSFTVGVVIPEIEFPLNNEMITLSDPIFKWKKVQDNNAVFKYRVTVTRQDNNKIVWQINDLTENSVKYNQDGKALEPLTIHKSYKIKVDAYDNNNHESYAESSFSLGEYYYVENSYLKIKFNSEYPGVEQYLDKINGAILFGDLAKDMYSVKVYYQNVGINVTPLVDSITIKTDRTVYHLTATINTIKAVSFDFSFILNERTLELIFDNVKETSGYKLTNVRSSDLLTVRADQIGAKLVFPESEGRLIDVATATLASDEINMQNSGWRNPLILAMLYHQEFLGIVKYEHLDINLLARTINHSTLGKFSSLGINFNYRYAPTDFSKAGFIDVFDSTTTEMKVRISLLGDFDNSGQIDWMDGAKFIRNQFQSSPLDIYANTFMTQMGLNQGAHISTSLSVIKKIYNLTDHNKIWCDLHNFNNVLYPGWMALYGEPIDTDPGFGTEQEIKDYFRMVKNVYNTSIDLSDAYCDYYPEFPTYDPSLRVVNADGTFYPGWPFSWVKEAYQISLYDYALKYGFDRIKKTLARYPFQETKTHHIDGFSLILMKNHSLQYPSSYQKYRRGDQIIIDEFNKAGISLTSEGLTDRFVGSVGWFYHSPRSYDKGNLSANSQIIPLIQFIVHGKTLYGLSKDNFYTFQTMPDEKAKILSFLDNLITGSSSGSWSWYLANKTSSSSPVDIYSLEIDRFYFIDIPWMLTNKKFMDKYEENGDYAKTTYDANTFVEANYAANTYIVQVDGKVISKNYTTIYPKDPNTFLIFSRSAKTITIPLPSEWSGKVFLQKLTVDGAQGNINYQISNRNVIFNVEENTPYKLVRNDATAISLPEKVNLISPTNNSVKQPTTFIWSSPTVPAEFYKLQVATDSIFTNVVSEDSTIKNTKAVFDKSNDNTKYYWRVKAKNSRGSGVWSDVFSFTSQKNYEADIRFGTNQPRHGIEQPFNRPDAAYKTTIIKNSPCVYNDINSNPTSNYLYFSIDDNKVFSGNSLSCWVTIEYYDTLSTGQIALNYDSPGNSLQDMYKSSPMVTISNTRTWKAYTFNVTDAFFGNREGGGVADFRLYASGVMFIRRVNVSSNDTYNFSPIIPTLAYPADASTKSPVKLKFDWSDNLRASYYHFQLSKNILFSNLVYNDSTLTTNSKLFDNLEINTQYYWRVRSTNLATQSDWSPIWSFKTNTSTDVKSEEMPTIFSLSQNYPNPFNPATIFKFGIPKESKVKLEIYNVLGQRIVQLVDETKSAGYYSVNWNASNFASGVYIYKLEAIPTNSGEIFRDVKKMILIK
ncbi:MAG: T9SS type A sorting domain-containing protein [Melioribacteraceae bacterium]